MKQFIIEFLVFFIFAALERWLGSTKKVESNSTVELVERLIKGKKL